MAAMLLPELVVAAKFDPRLFPVQDTHLGGIRHA
jgi:hypothetical protein